MAIISKKLSELPVATDPAQFDIFGQDRVTGQSAKAQMDLLQGEKGDAPAITIVMQTLPYGSAPTVDKSGTAEDATFTIGFPLAKNGDTPQLRVSSDYIQYRYSDSDTWTNLVPLDSLRLHFSDLTDDDISELQAPAMEAADAANAAAENANNAAEAANTAAENVQDGKTPVFSGSTATGIDPTQPPTVSLSQTGTDASGNPVYSLSFGIPQGQQGNQGLPPILVNGTIVTGSPGSSVSFTFTYSGTNAQGAPIYRVDGSIPQGAPGTGNGNVEIDASTLEVGKQYVFVPNENGSPIGTFEELVIPDDQTQPDWQQEDTTAKDFIKNKPPLKPVATSGAYNDLSGKPNLTPPFVTGNTYDANATGVSQTLQNRSIENGAGAPVVVQLPVATEDAAGVMPASAFEQIQSNTQDILRLKSQTGGVRLGSFATKADLDAFTLPEGAKAGDNAIVRDDETHGDVTTSYALIDTGGGVLGWDFDFVVNYDPIGIATLTTPGLKKSSTLDGQTFTETDGTDSVVGWDALKQRVTNVETGLLTISSGLSYLSGSNVVSTLSDLPVTRQSIIANISAATSMSVSAGMSEGTMLQLKIYNTSSSDITQAIPNGTGWETPQDSVTVVAGGNVELNIWYINGIYSVRILS